MKKLLSHFQSFLDGLEKFTMAVTCTVLAILLANESLGILADVMGYSIPWITEVSVILFAWVIFLGAGVITRKCGHISLDFLVERLPSHAKPLLLALNTALMLFVAFAMVYYGGKQALFVGQYQKTVYLQISLFYLYISVPAGGFLLGLNAIGAALPGGMQAEISKLAKIEENPLY
ncbi:MAG: TRAP transporter small permease [Deltaproteobacteria bacterium]|nr:TRAP transporter small permease [Deltaproteobacteria bacterium]